MKDFVSLPDRILAQILGYDDTSFLVISLWKTGDKMLRHKLSRSCERVILKDDDGASTSRWPKVLAELHQLRELCITRTYGYLMSPIPLSFELLKLSPTLKKLELKCYEIDNAFWNFDRFKLADGSLQPISMADVDILELQLRDLDSVWPRLEQFSISSQKIGSFIQPSIVTVLPRSLTMLSLFISIGDESFAALPPSLTSLEVNRFLQTSHWPSQFIKLSPVPLHRTTAIETLKALPRGLKSEVVGLQNITFTKEIAEALPPSLESLRISHNALVSSFDEAINGPWTNAFPPRLTSLVFTSGLTILDAHHVAALPRTLTSLFGLSADYLSFQQYATKGNGNGEAKLNLDFWPPNLHSLRLNGNTSSSTLVLACLPTTLRSLEFQAPPTINTPLPPRLTQLAIANDKTVTFEVPFPPNLTDLTLEGDIDYVPNDPWPASLRSITHSRNSSPVFGFEHVILARAPSTLQDLTMRSTTKLWKKLPSSLTSFFSSIHGPAPDIDDFASLPSKLRELEVFCEKHHGVLDHKVLSRLPKDLTRLSVGNCEFDGKVLRLLPRRLRLLRITFTSLDLESIQKMPQHLSVCEMAPLGNTTEDKSALINAMPDSLFLIRLGREPDREMIAHQNASLYPDRRITAHYN